MVWSAALLTLVLTVGAVLHARDVGAQPTDIRDCRPIAEPGSYVLTRNVTATADCLVVTANFVTIDLGGFVITGAGAAVGIRADIDPSGAGVEGTTVRNGTITGFGTGIFVGPGSVVEGVRVSGNGAGIVATGTVRNNTAVNNRTGIIALGTVSGNTAQSNLQRGIEVDANSAVTGNNAAGNGEVGILVDCPSNVIGNTAVGNDRENLTLQGAGCVNIDNLAPAAIARRAPVPAPVTTEPIDIPRRTGSAPVQQ